MQTNTYQAILATDGTNSFAIFTYKCGDLEWDGGAVIGFGASSEMFSNQRLSGTGRSLAIACLNDPGNQFSNVVFELTDSRDGMSTPCMFHCWYTRVLCKSSMASLASMHLHFLTVNYTDLHTIQDSGCTSS